jgi:hypothetical protein
MIGGYRNTAELRLAVREAAQRLQETLERDLRERGLPIPYMRGGRVYKRTSDGTVAVR